ncbi:Amino-acid permease BAT1 [Glycine max]|nr:Amino-acid permease BAT1 [Glycine max]
MLTRKITLAINTPILFFFIHLLLSLCDCLIMGSSHVTANGHAPLDSGHARLKELGYKQELKRDLSVISNFAFSFSIISVLTGVTTLYNTGLNYGGPVSLVYGWFVASGFTMLVALSMAEICSSYPTSGGLYYWSAKLAGPRWAPFASWITGWFNIVGQWAVTTSVDYSLAQLIQVIILLSTGGKNGGGYEASKYVVIAFHGGILFLHGVFVLMIVIPSVATERASAKFVFTHFNTENGEGINSKPYIFLLGLLLSQYTLTGFDASAHMTEETKDADRNGPKGIISSVGISIVVGWGYILGITFAVTDILYLLSEDNDAGGYAIAQVFYQAFKKRYGHGTGGTICLVIVAVAIFFCGMSSVTSNSRMAYAFSRDGAMPLSSLWHQVNNQEVPIYAVWLSVFISFCMALTSLGSIVAFEAMVSIATIGLYIAYAFPIFFRVTLAKKHFVPGPFNLGRYGVVVGWVAVLWVLTISVLFSLPVSYPITIETLNYTPVAVGCLLILVLSYWIISVSSDVGYVPLDSGHARLRQLGYKQELNRHLSVISNFAFSFSIISVLTGVTTLYNTGLNYGGPVSFVYGWFIASGFTMIVALSMAEICSSYPTSGGLYYWSAKLAGPRWAPFASWITGWFNIVGQWAVTTSVDYSLAQLIQVIILLSTGGKNGGGYEASKYVVIAFHGGILLLHGVFVLMIVIPSVATERASAKFVFTYFNTENEDGISSRPYIFLLGLLMSQYTLTGFDASAHMTEETRDADRNGPKGIISAVGISIIAGWGYILGISFAVTDIHYLLSEDNDTGGYAIAEVFYQAFKKRYGHGTGGIFCLSLGSIVAFEAMVSIATIGLYIAYALPIFFRVTLAQKDFVHGPFNLGRYGVIVGWVAVFWVVFISILFSLPVSYPITIETLNYTPVAVGCLLILVVSYWLISGRRWFRGPITNI